jgi:phospholipid/cholesterol/gamma-HCH transport system substrate-binding protein
MTTPTSPNTLEPSEIAYLELKARMLIAFMVLLVVGSSLYVMYARGWFEETQRLVLVADDSEGVVVGMNMTFSGFPIGRVQRIELAPDGKARILVDVAAKDAHWLRTSSIFTLSRGLVGSPNIRAYTGITTDPPLLDKAERSVLQGDLSAELPRVISSTKELLDNLAALTASEGPMGASLGNVQKLTARLNEPNGALDKTNQLLAQANTLAKKTDTQVFGKDGLMPRTQATMSEAQATVAQLNALLADARGSLQKVDVVLKNAQTVSADATTISHNAAIASADLGALRAEVDASLRKVQSLVDEVNRKWPFARDAEIQLP